MGLGESNSAIATEIGLDVPSNLPLKNRGTTGLQLPTMKEINGDLILYPKLESHSPGDVMQYIAEQANTYGEYIPSVWDCEDYAYIAAADVRRRFPGQPVGVLLGIGKYGGKNIVNKGHAINILWFEEDIGSGKKNWYPRYYDATIKEEITKDKADPEFETYVVIPFPVGCSDNRIEYRDFSPFTSFQFIDKATLALDRAAYDFGALGDIKKMLNEWKLIGYGKGGQVESGLYTPNDIVFYWFAHIRRWYAHIRKPLPDKVPPVGVAFGKLAGGQDFRSLILWSSKTEYTYFHPTLGEVDKPLKSGPNKFNPRLVIV